MNIVQRRANRGGRKVRVGILSKRLKGYQQVLYQRWNTLAARDRLALVFLSTFLMLFIGGYGGYSVHQSAQKSKENYQEQVADYFWLRAQAGNIDNSGNSVSSQNDSSQPPANQVNAALNAAGIDNAQVVAMGETVQLSFTHPSQAVVSTTLAQFERQDWSITQLSLQQDEITKQLQVQATVKP